MPRGAFALAFVLFVVAAALAADIQLEPGPGVRSERGGEAQSGMPEQARRQRH